MNNICACVKSLFMHASVRILLSHEHMGLCMRVPVCVCVCVCLRVRVMNVHGQGRDAGPSQKTSASSFLHMGFISRRAAL